MLGNSLFYYKGHITLCVGFAFWSGAQQTQLKRNQTQAALGILHWLLLGCCSRFARVLLALGHVGSRFACVGSRFARVG